MKVVVVDIGPPREHVTTFYYEKMECFSETHGDHSLTFNPVIRSKMTIIPLLLLLFNPVSLVALR